MSVTTNDRLLDSLRSITEAEIRAVVGYPGTYDYVIVSGDTDTISAEPAASDLDLPGLNHVPMRTSSIGAVDPSAGKRCHILFLNGDKRKPVCTWVEPDSGDPIAREGDAVNAGYLVTTTVPPGGVVAYFPGNIIGQAAAQAAASALTPPGNVVAMTGAEITGGSSKVTSE
jgi:hypothetical protein